MNPSGDAKTFYKTHQSKAAEQYANQKAKEAREALRDKLGLGEVNQYEAKNQTKREHA